MKIVGFATYTYTHATHQDTHDSICTYHSADVSSEVATVVAAVEACGAVVVLADAFEVVTVTQTNNG